MNSKHISAKARAHIGKVKALPCSVCDEPGPSSAHQTEQGLHFTVVALCWDCHQGPTMGWHGQRRAWTVRKMDELDALDVTVARLA